MMADIHAHLQVKIKTFNVLQEAMLTVIKNTVEAFCCLQRDLRGKKNYVVKKRLVFSSSFLICLSYHDGIHLHLIFYETMLHITYILHMYFIYFLLSITSTCNLVHSKVSIFMKKRRKKSD